MITNKTYEEINVGDSARLQRTMTKRDVDLFAVLSGDMNPTHFSDEYAQLLLERQKLTGHSMWGATLISSLLGNELPGPGTVYQSQHLEFHNALQLGDTIDVKITVKDKIADQKRIICKGPKSDIDTEKYEDTEKISEPHDAPLKPIDGKISLHSRPLLPAAAGKSLARSHRDTRLGTPLP